MMMMMMMMMIYKTMLETRVLLPVEEVIGVLLVSRSVLVEEDAVEVFNCYGFHLCSYFVM